MECCGWVVPKERAPGWHYLGGWIFQLFLKTHTCNKHCGGAKMWRLEGSASRPSASCAGTARISSINKIRTEKVRIFWLWASAMSGRFTGLCNRWCINVLFLLTVNTASLHYKDEPVSAVCEHNHCYTTLAATVWAERKLSSHNIGAVSKVKSKLVPAPVMKERYSCTYS